MNDNLKNEVSDVFFRKTNVTIYHKKIGILLGAMKFFC